MAEPQYKVEFQRRVDPSILRGESRALILWKIQKAPPEEVRRKPWLRTNLKHSTLAHLSWLGEELWIANSTCCGRIVAPRKHNGSLGTFVCSGCLCPTYLPESERQETAYRQETEGALLEVHLARALAEEGDVLRTTLLALELENEASELILKALPKS